MKTVKTGLEKTRVERMANGLVRLQDVRTGLAGLYTASGEYRSGDLMLSGWVVKAIFKAESKITG